MLNTLYIDWQPNVEIFNLFGYSVRWYAMGWILSVLVPYFIVRWLYKDQGIDPVLDKKGKWVETGKFDPLVFYCFFGMVVGARLGHCIFYEPNYFLTSAQGWVEMFLPIKFDEFPSHWRFTGYMGLASHGGTIGLFLALLLYARIHQVQTWKLLDMIGIAAPFAASFIRFGNLMNSEIIGKVTDVPWAFIFHTQDALQNGQLVPRHPAQLYEALAYIAIFIVGWWIFKKKAWHLAIEKEKTIEKFGGNKDEKEKKETLGRFDVGSGFYFGFCIFCIFLFRFFVEFLKEVQGGVDDGSTTFDVGQMLSIPFVLVGLWCMLRPLKKSK